MAKPKQHVNKPNPENGGALTKEAVKELQAAYDAGMLSGATLDQIDPDSQVGEDDDA
jgi:hypothetical protein